MISDVIALMYKKYVNTDTNQNREFDIWFFFLVFILLLLLDVIIFNSLLNIPISFNGILSLVFILILNILYTIAYWRQPTQKEGKNKWTDMARHDTMGVAINADFFLFFVF